MSGIVTVTVGGTIGIIAAASFTGRGRFVTAEVAATGLFFDTGTCLTAVAGSDAVFTFVRNITGFLTAVIINTVFCQTLVIVVTGLALNQYAVTFAVTDIAGFVTGIIILLAADDILTDTRFTGLTGSAAGAFATGVVNTVSGRTGGSGAVRAEVQRTAGLAGLMVLFTLGSSFLNVRGMI